MTRADFLSFVQAERGSTAFANTLLKICASIAALDQAEATQELPGIAVPEEIQIARHRARQAISDNIKKVAKGSGGVDYRWRIEQAGPTGLRVAPPGRGVFVEVPWE